MTKHCRARLFIPSLERHFFVNFQRPCCVRFVMSYVRAPCFRTRICFPQVQNYNDDCLLNANETNLTRLPIPSIFLLQANWFVVLNRPWPVSISWRGENYLYCSVAGPVINVLPLNTWQQGRVSNRRNTRQSLFHKYWNDANHRPKHYTWLCLRIH